MDNGSTSDRPPHFNLLQRPQPQKIRTVRPHRTTLCLERTSGGCQLAIVRTGVTSPDGLEAQKIEGPDSSIPRIAGDEKLQEAILKFQISLRFPASCSSSPIVQAAVGTSRLAQPISCYSQTPQQKFRMPHPISRIASVYIHLFALPLSPPNMPDGYAAAHAKCRCPVSCCGRR